MTSHIPLQANPVGATGDIMHGGKLKIEILSGGSAAPGSADAAQFRAALERQMSAQATAAPSRPGKPSLGEKIAGRTANLASEMQKDQQYVSKLLEQASRTGDSMQLMKAMMALNDYNIRVQTISKTVSKTTSAFEQLTKLQ